MVSRLAIWPEIGFKRRFVRDSSLALYLPIWHPDLSGSPFLSKDLNAHSCTNYGTTWGLYGRTFDGTDDKIDCGNSSVLNFTSSAFSIGFWLNPDLTALRRLFTRGDYNVGGYLCQVSAAGALNFYTCKAGSSQSTITANGTVVASTWQQMMIVRDGANIKIYKNGVDTNTSSGAHENPVTSTASLLIGVDEDAGNWYKGIMGEFLIHSRAPTPAEALGVFNATKGRYGL